MARKITLSMIVVLIISAFVFVSCSQEAGGGGVPGPAPTPKEKVVNVAGEVSGNLVYNGDFESGADSDLTSEECTVKILEGEGIDGSNALSVTANVKYSEMWVDLTKYYGSGKSFYVEGWFKNVGGEGTKTTDLTARIAFNIVTGGGYNYEGQTWDIPGQYDGDWLSDDEAEEIFGIETNCIGEDISDGDWHKVSAIIDAEQIATVMASEDDQTHWNGDTTMYLFSVVFFVGNYDAGQDGYVYLLDNVVIKDLNKELPRQGKTYEEPEEEEPEENLEDL